MRIEKVIEELGFKPNEAKVYVAALALGECHISDIAAKVNLPRSSAQAIVDKLHKVGLMNFYVRRRYKYWVAENPERILADFVRKEEKIRGALPALLALRKAGHSRTQHGTGRSMDAGPFHILADTSLQPILITNRNAEIEYVNAAWEDQFGYSLNDIRGQNPRILKSGKTPAGVHERMWKALTAGKLFQSDAVVDRRKDGTCFNLLTTVFPVRYGSAVYYIQILDDITDGKKAGQVRQDFIRTAAGGKAS
ncbi:hypothetical protein A3D71_01595 [Candidatus Kaiserbacteria bacterium RIFCSPHIGHO2_02_FULL_55_20]|uniref:PAS domain-containing protein n=1 Tax=Candidatus Kaiserbacteria bacterium RIFCSPHIGHO2_02_FULL_55_20 TaxID=1798497 RepID=A0A1F6DXP7_9BACT|nr:MAG: hypothetical protein A2680_01125 [Candidatus Kaiserbacteria bacterium RIFCSPHIGHO2_01_FULL_55_37]OGG66193.1 MAG: hypothetical protein A3D71_01595 [Candidatus Kaiserbacteria bacterium RIFCSPHIGHO2_02_FULL_55_20]